MLIRIESVFFNNKDNKDDIIYYPQAFLGKPRYVQMNNRILCIDNSDLSDNEPKIETESEEEFNESTVQ